MSRPALLLIVVSAACGKRAEAPDRGWVEKLPAAVAVARCADEAACLTACEGGEGAACVRAAAFARVERGDLEAAAGVLGPACERGLAAACFELGLLDFHVLYAGRDQARGLARIEKACEAGARRACEVLADSYAVGSPMPADPARAEALNQRVIEIARAACDAGSGDDCGALANARLKVRQRADQTEVHGLLRRACTLGSAGGCAGASTPFLSGSAADRAAAQALLERACAIDPAECSGLAFAAETGLAREKKDPARAAELYRRACAAWSPAACGWLAANATDDPAAARTRACRIQSSPSCAPAN
ncbi:MAG TPA: hypothetical protein VMZ28_19830 [Kofleriaceae bacterium]|nr:hypothetical protein [Kofleriaceae bacterium]